MFDIKKNVAEAMYDLVLRKDFNQITATELIEASGISRSTFYRHFKDKYDVMFYYYRMEVDALISEEIHNCKELLFYIFNFIQYRRRFFTRVFNLEGPNSFIRFLYQYSFEFYERKYKKSIKKTWIQVIVIFWSMYVLVQLKWLSSG